MCVGRDFSPSFLSSHSPLPPSLPSPQERLNPLAADKASIQNELAKVEERLQNAYQVQGQRPRETEAELEKAMKDLEYKRTTQSMSLMDEKKLLRQIGLYKKEKLRVKEYNLAEEGLKSLKAHKYHLHDERKAKEGAMTELSKALRKMQLAQRVGVAAEELIEEGLEVPEGCMARLVGKGGMNLRRIEEACAVSIDFDHGGGGSGRISGSAAAVAAAREQIEEVTAAVSEEIKVSPSLCATLLTGRAARTQALMNEHKVRIEIIREKKLVKAQGLPSRLASLKSALTLLETQTVRREVPVDVKLIGPVVGKGGVHLRQLEEEFPGVGIEVHREEGHFLVVGLEGEVEGVVAALERLACSLEDKEERIVIDKVLGHVLMDEQGKILKEMRRAAGCNLFLDMKKEEESGVLSVRAPIALLEAAVEETRRRVGELEGMVLCMNVDPSMVRFIIGKKGAVINALRAQTQALIEAEDKSGMLRIYHPEEGGREAAKAAVLEVVSKNQAVEVEVPREAAMALKGGKGVELRGKCAAAGVEVQLDIDAERGVIGLRGAEEKMEKVREWLLVFAEENFGVEIDLPPEDYLTLVSEGGTEGGSLKKQVQEATGVQLFTIKEENLLKIRGSREACAQAELLLRQALEGGEAEGTTVHVPLHPDAYPGLVGKAGAGINKFREEHGVALILLRMRNQIRVRGGSREQVAKAAVALRSLLAGLRSLVIVQASASVKEGVEERRGELGPFKEQFDIQVDSVPEGYKLRGLVAEVAAAKQRLIELLTQRAKAIIPLTPPQCATLAAGGEGNWRKVRDDYAVACELDQEKNQVVLQGATAAVGRAQGFVCSMLEILLGGEMGHVSVPVPALAALASPAAVEKIKSLTGVEEVWVDREGGLVRVRGGVEAVRAVPAAVEGWLKTWGESHARVAFEGWMLPYLMGKGGGKVKELQKRTGAAVEIDREGCVVHLAPGTGGVKKKKKEKKGKKGGRKEGGRKEEERKTEEKKRADALVASVVGEGGEEGGREEGEEDEVRAAEMAAVDETLLEEELEGEAEEEEEEEGEEEEEEEEEATPGKPVDEEARGIASVQAAKAWLLQEIVIIKKEHTQVIITVPQEILPYFIGKKGANLAKLRDESKATLDIMNNEGGREGGRDNHRGDHRGDHREGGREGGRGGGWRTFPNPSSSGASGLPAMSPAPAGMVYVRIKGGEEALVKAQELVNAFVSEWQLQNVQKEVKVLAEQIRLIVGGKGATIRGITEESGAKLDVDRERSVVVVRGKLESVEKAVALVQAIIEEDKTANAERRAQQQQQQQQQERSVNGSAATHPSPTTSSSSAAAAAVAAAAAAAAVAAAAAAATAAVASTHCNSKNGEWNFPTVPPGADASYSKLLLEKQAAVAAAAAEKRKRKKQNKKLRDMAAKEEGEGGREEVVAVPAVPAAAAPAPAVVVEEKKGVAMNGGGGGGKVKKEAPKKEEEGAREEEAVVPPKKTKTSPTTSSSSSSEARAALAKVAEVVKTEKAGQLLDLIMGGAAPAAPPAAAAAAAAAAPAVMLQQQQQEVGNGRAPAAVFKSSASMLRL